MTPSPLPHDIKGVWRILKWYIFRGLSFFEILGGAVYARGAQVLFGQLATTQGINL